MRILIVEDERNLANALRMLLIRNGFTADAVFDGESGLDYAMSGIYDIIILDIMLPKLSGGGILKTLRESGVQTPVIMLTAKQDSCADFLNSGADDYVEKPYEAEELIARIRAVLRRRSEISQVETIAFSDIELNISDMKLKCGNSEIPLTRKELGLMEYLIANRNFVVSKEQIIRKLWGFESEAEANHVEVYISFLRKKLKALKSKTRITTVRSIGYSLREKEV